MPKTAAILAITALRINQAYDEQAKKLPIGGCQDIQEVLRQGFKIFGVGIAGGDCDEEPERSGGPPAHQLAASAPRSWCVPKSS